MSGGAHRCLVLMCVLAALAGAAAGAHGAVPSHSSAGTPTLPTAFVVLVDVGENLSPRVAARVVTLLEMVPGVRVISDRTGGDPALVLGLGNSATTRSIISAADLARVGPEGFVLRSSRSHARVFATDGVAQTDDALCNRGVVYGVYELLQHLGFVFAHPLQPIAPPQLQLPAAALHVVEAGPELETRLWHVHTEHPLELTEMLNGMSRLGGRANASAWEALLPEWTATLEWLVANKQNQVEWILLAAAEWAEWAWSAERQARLRTLTTHAHDFCVAAGADVPIVEKQQHAMMLVQSPGADAAVVRGQLRKSVAWVMAAGFDFLSTEMGFSEFTHPNATLMLRWMNETVACVEDEYGKHVYVKAHCSTGQTAAGYVDPATGKPLNFNFLSMYADSRVRPMPHTVQFYTLDQPTSGAYGNANFSYMADFMHEVARRGYHTIFYPETTYWVSYDSSVPLFLPVYARGRYEDMAYVKRTQGEGRVRGMGVFSSGWEWGYWLQELVTARAAWRVEPTYEAALAQMAKATFGRGVAPQVAALLRKTTHVQTELLVYGRVDGEAPASTYKRNGMAYLEGWDTWAILGSLVGHMSVMPERYSPGNLHLPAHGHEYHAIKPLLAALDTQFGALAAEWAALAEADAVPAHVRPLLRELADGAEVTALRARMVHGVFDFVGMQWELGKEAERVARLRDAVRAIEQAQRVVRRREAAYRVPVERVAGWRANPTAYEYTFLWAPHTLYYWWRDVAEAVIFPLSPCYMNVISPVDVAVGDGPLYRVLEEARALAHEVPLLHDLTDCMGAPEHEPTMPPALVRDALRVHGIHVNTTE